MNIPAVTEIKIKKNKGIIILFSNGQIPMLTFSELEIEKNITKKNKMINNNLEKSFINIMFILNEELRN